MITKVHWWFACLVLVTLTVPASALASQIRHDPPVVTRFVQEGRYNRIHFRIGDETRIEAVTAVVNGFVSAGSPLLTRDEIALQLRGRILFVCEATAHTPRTHSRDPEFFATCPLAAHDYWIPNRASGIVVTVHHVQTRDELLVDTLADNLRLRAHKARLETALAASEASHPTIQFVRDPEEGVRIRLLQADVVTLNSTIETMRHQKLRLSILLGFAAVGIIWLAALVDRKRRALAAEKRRAEHQHEELVQEHKQERGALIGSVTALTNANLTTGAELKRVANEYQETLRGIAGERAGLQAIAENESVKDLRRELVEARTQIESLGAQLAHAKSDTSLDQLQELSEQHARLVLYSQNLEAEALKDTSTISSLLNQLAEKDLLLQQLQSTPVGV